MAYISRWIKHEVFSHSRVLPVATTVPQVSNQLSAVCLKLETFITSDWAVWKAVPLYIVGCQQDADSVPMFFSALLFLRVVIHAAVMLLVKQKILPRHCGGIEWKDFSFFLFRFFFTGNLGCSVVLTKTTEWLLETRVRAAAQTVFMTVC